LSISELNIGKVFSVMYYNNTKTCAAKPFRYLKADGKNDS
jgi:hypothetical protein